MKFMPRLIALTGPAGCGKDTVRQLLERHHNFHGMAFADPLRDMLHALFEGCGIPLEYMTERSMKEMPIPGLRGLSYRRLVQTLGTEWGQGLDRLMWVNLASVRLADWYSQSSRPVVISDLRFHHEAAWVRDCGGVIWRVLRDVAPVRHHESEMQLHAISHDVAIDNTGTVGELLENIEAALERYKA